MFNAALLVREDTRKVYPERRFIGYNTVDGRLIKHTHHFFQKGQRS
jgi:hypothetical protein